MKRVFATLAILVLALALFAGCEARELPKDAIAALLTDLQGADSASLTETVLPAEVITALLDPDGEGLARGMTKVVLAGVTFTTGDMRGTYDATRVVLTIENRDLAAVAAAYTDALAAAGEEPLSKEARLALFAEAYAAAEATVSTEAVVTMNYDARAVRWKFSVPEEFWGGVLGGDPALLSALA